MVIQNQVIHEQPLFNSTDHLLPDSMAEACYQELHGARYTRLYMYMEKYIPDTC